MMKLKTLHYLLFLSIFSIITGCAKIETRQQKLRKLSADQLIQDGRQELSSGQYTTAIEHFNILQARFPQGVHAQQAKLEKIYALYIDRKADEALKEIDQFTKFYPDHASIDYVWYMRGVVNFDRARSIIDRYLPPDQSQIDSQQLRTSLADFETLMKKYPDSSYIDDTKQRIAYLNNILAKGELNIANYYMRRNAYVAAANRAQFVLDHYPQTSVTKDALITQILAYDALKLTQQKQDRIDILKLNFPNDPKTLLILEGKDPRKAENFLQRFF